jgi:hypothetical protein
MASHFQNQPATGKSRRQSRRQEQTPIIFFEVKTLFRFYCFLLVSLITRLFDSPCEFK